MNLSNLKNNELLTHFSLVVQKEREVICEVILYLSQIWIRKLYAESGYSSLFNFLVEKYHYSGGAAYRRIQAAKLYQRFPEIIEFLKEGKLNLMTISLIEPHVDKAGKELITKVLNKSKNEVETILAELNIREARVQDVIRRLPVQVKKKEVLSISTGGNDVNKKEAEEPVSQKETGTSLEMSLSLSGTEEKVQEEEIRRVKIEFVANEKVAQKIERAKQILRHKYPQGKLENIIDEALEALLEKKDPERKIQCTEKKETKQKINEPKSTFHIETRYIPQQLRREIWKRDKGKCTFQSKDGKQCNEQGMLEIDHVQPFALNGKNSLENLRLLCTIHNKWRAQKTFDEVKFLKHSS